MKESQKRKIKKVAKALNKASRSHAGQAKTLSTLKGFLVMASQ